MAARSLEREPLHLGAGGVAVPQPGFTGEAQWYEAYVDRHAGDGEAGRLVAAHRFTASWEGWEMHPAGDEVVYCTAGTMTLHQEFPDGHRESVTISAGEYAVNPPGVWHTADITGEAAALFITPGWAPSTGRARVRRLKRESRPASLGTNGGVAGFAHFTLNLR